MSNAADDTDTWLSSALVHAELAAHQIARFTNPWWDPTWRDLVPYDPPPPLTVGWGTRGRRSRSEKKHAVAAAAAAAAAAASSCSPDAPFDFGAGSGVGSGSGASTSGGDEGFGSLKRRRMVGDGVIGRCEVGPISVRKDIRRTGRKKTLCELQEEERLLLEHKNQLQKEVETRMKAYEGLRAENQRLKSQQASLHSEKVTVRSTTTSFEFPGSSTRFILPDLNEPLPEINFC